MRTLNLLDLEILYYELKYLEGTQVDKVFHKGSEILIRLFSKKTKTNILKIKVGSFISKTEYKEINQDPTSFAMLLRKSIGGYTLRTIRQIENERIFDLTFEKGEDKKVLVVELFSKGNVILCEPSFNIIFSLKRQVWAGRRIQSGKKYTLPPKNFNPSNINRRIFMEKLEKTTSDDIVRFLAVDLGFGGVYSEELLALSRVDKNKRVKELDKEELNSINDNIRSLLIRIKGLQLNPQVVNYGEEAIPLPFDFVTFQDQKPTYFETYNQAVDYASTLLKSKEIKEQAVVDVNREMRKIARIKEDQTEKFNELKTKMETNQRKGELIYIHFNEIKEVIDEIMALNEEKVSWDEIKQKSFNNLKSIDETNGKLYFEFDGFEIKIDISKGLMKSSEEYFFKSKKSKEKIKGLETSIKDMEKRLEQTKVAKERRIIKSEKVLPKKIESKKWYEYFHYFTSSGGLFVLSGKDAQTNEILIKKYMEPNDLVFHTEMAGSPFTLIKEGKNASEEDILEAAIQTASFSRAWRMGYGTTDVFWVSPEQVSKTAPSGEHVPRGGFMISGKKNYVKNVELELAVGFKEGVVIGPKTAVSKISKYVVIKPGYLKKSEASEKIKLKLEKLLEVTIGIDSISSVLPSGNIKIEK